MSDTPPSGPVSAPAGSAGPGSTGARSSEARLGVAAIVADRDVVTVRGADSATFLQGQLSADVAALAVGASTWSLLLEPQGRLEAWVRVWRTAPDGFVLDVDAGWGEQVATRLRRFLLRVDVSIDVATWRWVALRGPESSSVALGPADLTDARLVAPTDWRGLPGVDLLAVDAAVPDGIPVLSAEESEVLRIEQGWPAMGRELDDSVIPAEIGQWFIDASVSFTKGCYTGQELVARVDSRGSNTPRRLRGVLVTDRLDDPSGAPEGSEVVHDGQVRGALSSLTCSPELGGLLGLALLHRSVDDGDDVEVRWSGGHVAARVVDLPADRTTPA